MYDLLIIGAGPAGIAAAIYAKRSGMNVAIFEKNYIGGLMNYTNKIENYPGYLNISGPEMSDIMTKQLENLNVLLIKEEVKTVLKGDIKTIITTNKEYKTKNVLIATGRQPRKLNLPYENELSGSGISYCAICDAPFFKDKVVAVLGGGDSAFEEGIYLSSFAKKVYILNRGKVLKANSIFIDRASKLDNIEIISDVTVKELIPFDNKLSKIVLTNDTTLEVEGLFIYIGYVPKTDFLSNLNIINDFGYITVDKNYETKEKGIYAAGDIIEKDYYQIITACSEGATAALNAYKNIK